MRLYVLTIALGWVLIGHSPARSQMPQGFRTPSNRLFRLPSLPATQVPPSLRPGAFSVTPAMPRIGPHASPFAFTAPATPQVPTLGPNPVIPAPRSPLGVSGFATNDVFGVGGNLPGAGNRHYSGGVTVPSYGPPNYAAGASFPAGRGFLGIGATITPGGLTGGGVSLGLPLGAPPR